MPDQPYSQDDLRAEAARWVGDDIDGLEVITAMADREPWVHLDNDTFNDAYAEVRRLINSAVDTSLWAVHLGADGLEPDDHHLQLGIDPGTGDEPRVRIQFAFAPEMTGPERDAFVVALAKVIAENL
ncbi:hypothetical protein [Streptomyces virginiae]|uniref:hypothetical protein n=1 Tax=Streptomyces virginiae TaxID=1961 RepID=UPI00343AD73A